MSSLVNENIENGDAEKTIEYHMIMTIGLAAFTFYCFIMAIINMVKYRD